MAGEDLQGQAGGLFQPKHLYSQVRDELARRIAQARYAPGSLLPNEYALSNELRVSIGTIRKAVELLVAEKLVVRAQGRGTIVADRHSPDFQGHFDRLRALDGSLVVWRFRDLTSEARPASALECRVLAMRQAENILSLKRLRDLDGRTVMREHCRLPASLFTNAMQSRAEDTTIEALAYQKGLVIAYSDEWLTLVPAPASVAASFGVDPHATVMRLERVVYDDTGRPVEWRIAHAQVGCLFYHAASPLGLKPGKHLAPFSPALHVHANDDEADV